MKLIAFKTMAGAPEDQKVAGYPDAWPWQECQNLTLEQAGTYRALGYTIMTLEEYESYKCALLPVETVKAVITSAMEFGADLIRQYAAENVLLGITQLNATGTVLSKLGGVLTAVSAGSLYEAITRIRAIPPEDYDSTFITAARLLTFINRIEAYLGIPLSEAL